MVYPIFPNTLNTHFSKTPLNPNHFGKSDSSRGDLSVEFSLQLFKTSNPNQRLVRYYASLANNGTVSIHRMILAKLHEPTAGPNNIIKNIWVSHSMNPGEYQDSRSATLFRDGNRQQIDYLNAEKTPFNAFIVTGSYTSLLVPTSYEWDNEKHNKHVFDLAKAFTECDSKNLTDEQRNTVYQQIWDAYVKAEKELENKGLLVPSNVIVANTNAINPIASMGQNLETKSNWLNGKAMLGNEGQLATYASNLNSVSGTFKFTDTAMDANTSYTYGLNSIRQVGERSLNAFSSEVLGFDMFNRLPSVPMSISVLDLNYETSTSRAENFQQFKESNVFFAIRSGKLTLRVVPGTLASHFHITGENMTYRKTEVSGVDVYTDLAELDVDSDDYEEIDSSETVSGNDVPFESDEF